MRIAFIGLKGIPAQWGGIERYVEEVATRLAERGHEVTAFGGRWYCRGFQGSHYKGVRLVRVPALNLPATEALTNAFFASVLAMLGDYDIAHLHNYGSYYFVPLLKARGLRTVVTAHGLESGWENPKYGGLGRWVVRKGFEVGMRHADAVSTVADYLADAMARSFGRQVTSLPVGSEETGPVGLELARRFGLEPGRFILFLGRLDPIKRVDLLIEAFKGTPMAGFKLVVAGNPSKQDYLRHLEALAAGNPDIVFAGVATGRLKAELLHNAAFVVAPSRAEGLPIVLLEAMRCARVCVASDIAAHRSVIRDADTGLLFEEGNLESLRQRLIEAQRLAPERAADIGRKAKEVAANQYSWERTVDRLEELYAGLAACPGRRIGGWTRGSRRA